MLLLTHRLGALGDLSPSAPALGYCSDPIIPPGCSRSLGPYSPSWRAPVSHGKAQPPFPASLQPATSPGAPSGSGVSVPRCASISPGVPAQPQPADSHPLWLSQSREEHGLEGWMGLSEGSPPVPGQTRERRGAGAVYRAQSQFHGPCGGICLPASRATHGL